MSWLENNKELVNIILVIVGILIFTYFLIPNIINSSIMAERINDLRDEVKELRRLVFKLSKK
jgi:preprotein translocase subunit SecY